MAVTNRTLAVIMDPIESIVPRKDSSLAMLLEAQRRGWQIHIGQAQDIWLENGIASGRLTRLSVSDDDREWFQLADTATVPLGDVDVILMRKDPPFDMEYIAATYILQRAEDQGALVINRPQGLRDASEKAFMAWFPQCAPPTMISRSLDQMRAFIAQHERVVVKPLDLMGGQSVFVTDLNDGNCNVVLETVSQRGQRYTMVQKYLPEISDTGDKRILMINGEPVPMVLARIPVPGDHRGNMVAGARTEIHPLTDRERWICEQVGPVLREKGLHFAGIDVIGEYMTEVNVTSPTGIRELDRATDCGVAQQLFDSISEQVSLR